MFLRCLLGFSLAVAVHSNTLDDLVPGKDFNKVTCDDGVCIRTDTVLVENTFWVEPESGLKYHEPRLFYVDTKDLYDHCAKDVAYKQLADTLDDCEDQMLEDVCEFRAKGWLKQDATVDEDAIKNTFKKIDGGEAMVNECLELEDDDYYEWEYDYYEYFADQWPQRRRRGAAGRGRRNRRTPATRRVRRQAKGGPAKVPSKGAAKKGLQGHRAANGPGPGAGRGFVKKAQGAQAGNGGAANQPGGKAQQGPKKPDEDKLDQRLEDIDVTKVPSKEDLDKLICVKKEAFNLMKDCGMDILSKAP